MRRRLPMLSVVICLAAAARAADAPPATRVFIKAGRVLDVRGGRYLEQQGILIEGERIKEVGPLADVERRAAGATAIDLGAATVLPGLIDGHGHLVSSMSGRLGTSENLLSAVAGMTASRRALLGAANAREALESGITTVRNVGHSGVDGDVALRDAIAQGWVPGPRMQAAARKITPTGGQAMEVRREAAALLELEYLPVTGVDEARRAVREDLAAGADVIKVVVDDRGRILGTDELRAVVEEAHRGGVKVAAHATTAAGTRSAVEAGVDSVEHGDEAADETLRLMREKGTVLVVTAWPPDLFRDLVYKSLVVEPADRAGLEGFLESWTPGQKRLVERARHAGVTIVVGSDMWVRMPGKTRGQAILSQLAGLDVVGLTAPEILRAVTVDAAALMGWSDRVGAVEPGKLADLIAVAGDPLRDARALLAVTFVMKGGTVVRSGAPVAP